MVLTPSWVMAWAIRSRAGSVQSRRSTTCPSGLWFDLASGVKYPPTPTRWPFWSGGRPVLSAPGRVALAPSLFRGLGASSPGFVFFRTHWAKACCSLHAAWINVAWSLLVLTQRSSFWSAGVKHNWFSGLLKHRSCWRTRITTWEYIGILRNTGNTGEYLGIPWNT